MCSWNVLLGDLLGVIRSVESDSLSESDLSVYLRIFLSVLFVSSVIKDILIMFMYYHHVFIYVSCFGLVVSHCQTIG